MRATIKETKLDGSVTYHDIPEPKHCNPFEPRPERTSAERVADLLDYLPSHVKIGPYKFRLELWDALGSISSNRYGEISTIEQRITIARAHSSPEKLLDTLLHEINHALYWLADLNDGEKEENVVRRLTTAQVQLFADNPWLNMFIQRALI